MSTQSESGTVRNGSKTGRPPRVDDDQLIVIVRGLTDAHGELPTLDTIIDAAGGCQRARAVAARKHVAQEQAKQSLDGGLLLSSEVESRHRKLLNEWLTLAREQMQPVIDEIVEAAEGKAANAEQATQDARANESRAINQSLEMQTQLDELRGSVNRLQQRLSRVIASEARWKALAKERQEMLRALTARGPQENGG